MPTRIYALAKDLKIDSKELVDICTKAGITGKGSALASLTDEELDKLKQFLASGTKKPESKPKSAPLAPIPPTPTPAPAPPPPAPPPVAAPAPIAAAIATPPTAPAPPASAPPAPATPAEAAPTRDSYVSPSSISKVKVLDGRPRSSQPKLGDEDGETRKPKKRAPVINVAPMPEAKAIPEPLRAEPKAQKPDIRLTKEALSGQKKVGGRAPLEHLTKPNDRKGKPAAAGPGQRAGEPPPAVAEAPGRGGGRKRGGGGRPEEGEADPLAGMSGSRADRQKARKSRQKERLASAGGEEDGTPSRPRNRTLIRTGANTAAPRKGSVTIELPCTVRSFSEATGIPSNRLLSALMKQGHMVNINAQIDEQFIEKLSAELGIEVDVKQPESLEDAMVSEIRDRPDDDDQLQPRPPIVTFLGHVDHGKTSLLDYLIGTNVVAGEAGGITQHIRAYQVEKDGRKISFVDTPGHEAFTEMRARGANVTDIAVLVVAADDGIMPQTEEAISHAKAAEVPIVVALNKIDLPAANATRVMTQMTEYQMTPSEWGGDVEVVPTSAITGQGMDQLLETLLGIAELHEYRANPSRDAFGICLEAQQEPARGVIAKVIVQNGTLRVGDIVVCGAAHGRVKAMYDTLQTTKRVTEAGPSTPVNITGLDIAPGAGDPFLVLSDIATAREIAESRSSRSRTQSLSGSTTKISFDDFQKRLAEGRLVGEDERVTLNLIIRADVRGSIEAIEKELGKLEHPEVQLKILQRSVGGISVADVTLAHASQAVIIGFNVIPDENARALAEEREVEIRRYDIIYKVSDDIKLMLEGKLKPEERAVELGRALVKQVFSISRVGTIAGCYVIQGTIERNCRVRVNRDGRTIGDYALESLRRHTDDTKEVPRGMECGMKLAGFNDIKKDDVLEAYRIEEVARTL